MQASNSTSSPAANLNQSLQKSASRNLRERLIALLLLACGLVSILTTFGIVAVLFEVTFEFFQEVSFAQFFLDTRWTPLFADQHFGIWPLINGTVLIAAIAMLIAVPLGLASAIYLSEYASSKLASILRPALELLAGIPTVVFGYFALLFVTPLLRSFLPLAIFNALSAGLVMGIMIIPTIGSISLDSLRAVPRSLREAAYGLGATKMEVTTKIVLPAALSGIIASIILGVSRAVGETMIVVIAAGQQPRLTLNPLESVAAMTAYIAQVAAGDTPRGTTAYKTLFAVGAVLFLMTLALNIISYWIARRYREVYD
ncbi:phosphate ABC transporter permease subunit PstC [Leptolyngbya sp. FACHB-261]|uniref:phosphate ABC transporter permease subunit PstC n=1 Tax=Leptolyngbya sp. FACHB-261 TaxID=2692806 RepID=UPI0016864AD8|nr:phosphate ABC transporter permease subunit PstC [Leptolyngbya sp. FACHB-261]MBD2101284.1 phosphate ABC transporter permease subunit PstC [Leptolyngbya sp. FACHB-261]